MEVHVDQLTKQIGQQTLVHPLTFQVAQGEILGFVGPNGAGKSTTLKMLTGYLKPTSGTVSIGTYNIHQHPQHAQQYLGYLSEDNPLYTAMYVQEHLYFMGRIRGLPAPLCKKKVEEILEQCAITAQKNQKIKHLSKGYRQRVGLAQALLHDPPVLILDEPTTGLDPNQRRSIQSLIQAISPQKAVIFSTHLLHEAQQVCHRVLLMHQGSAHLHTPLAPHTTHPPLLATFQAACPADTLTNLAAVEHLQALSDRQYIIWGGPTLREALFQFAQDHNQTLLRLEEKKDPLEELFQQLTASNHMPKTH